MAKPNAAMPQLIEVLELARMWVNLPANKQPEELRLFVNERLEAALAAARGESPSPTPDN